MSVTGVGMGHDRNTYKDLMEAPDHMIAEILDGALHLSPRPTAAHALALSHVTMDVGQPFGRGRGGPGGWWILAEPELWLGPPTRLRETVAVPDVAGWLRTRLPELPDAVGIALRPDWICEVLSPSSVRRDRVVKRAVYAEAGVPWLWWLDPAARTLEILELRQGEYTVIDGFSGEQTIRARPFDAVPLPLQEWWAAPPVAPVDPAVDPHRTV